MLAPVSVHGIHGILLAAGAGTRMGLPKALVHDVAGIPWVVRGVRSLLEGGCDAVTVVLGAAAVEATALLEGLEVSVVVAEDWAEGMSASLRAGLASVGDGSAVVVTLVDLPDVAGDVVRRVVGLGGEPAVLARASYGGSPGHPVLIGRDHWQGVMDTTRGDRGARDYLANHHVVLVECGDLATGLDVDTR